MVTAATNLGRSGVYDWLMQRVGAVVLLAYLLYIGVVVLCGGADNYVEWKALYSQTWMRVFSLLALLSLAAHAWVGLWTVFTDYLTVRMLGPSANMLRFGVLCIAGVIMFTYVIWGIQILWGL